MQAFTDIDCQAAVLPVDNIDTDRIIPARFLITTTREGMGEGLFADWEAGRKATNGAKLLVAGHNFGCGSSREHAVWALLDAGVQVVVSTGFADIFHTNALRNGLVPVTLEDSLHRKLIELHHAEPATPMRVDLHEQMLNYGTLSTPFPFDPLAKHCITRGLDDLGYLLEQLPAIQRFEEGHPARLDTTGGRR